MSRIVVAAIAALMVTLDVHAEETPAQSRVVSVDMFKNGLALVRRAVSAPRPGTYCVTDVPEPVHGTFWIESDAQVEVRTTMREFDAPGEGIDLEKELAGREVLIHFRDGAIPPASGRVVRPEPDEEKAWDRTYQRTDRWGYYYRSSSRPPQAERQPHYLVLETDDGRIYVDSSMIAYAQAEGERGKVTRPRPVLLFTVGEMKNRPANIRITYLTKGMAWAPSYRVDISDPDDLTITQKAVIKNELEHLEGAELHLISGFPSVQFGHVKSPLSLDTTWASFFEQLRTRRRPGQGLSQAMAQQVMMNVARPTAIELDLSAIPEGEGPDLHYQPVGARTLAEGDSLALDVASGRASYERIVEWIVPDTRRANGRHISEHERREDPEKYEDCAWDALRFRNPLPFPMTTAPAMIVAEGRFQGQRMSYWANKGEQATLHVTKALSIRTRSIEYEKQGEKREIVYLGGNDYQKTTVNGELTASNHRAESVTLVIRRRFSGELLKASRDPKCVLLEEGVYSVNKRNELVWTITLKPGKEATLTYQYTVLVDV